MVAAAHRLVGDGIKAILRAAGDIEVACETRSGRESIDLAKSAPADALILDVELTGLSGIEAATQIIRHRPDSRVLILSAFDDERTVVSAIRSGAKAFVLKDVSAEDFVDAVRLVASGGNYLSPQVSDRLLQRIQRGDTHVDSQTRLTDLSPRELQVMRLVAEGKTSKEIATLLGLGLQTIRSYRKTMMKKLDINNVATLTRLALSSGVTRVAKGAAAGDD